MRKIEITKWVIEIDEGKDKSKAELVGLDKDGNEYTLEYYDNSGNKCMRPNIICTEK